MHKITVIAIEDERPLLDFMEECLKSMDQVELLGKTDNVHEAYQLILKNQPDAVFTDIDIRGGDVISQVFQKIKMNGSKLPYLVFTSGHPEYASKIINEYRDHVIKFIEKPFVEDWEMKFQEALSAIQQKMQENKKSDVSIPEMDYLFIKSAENYVRLKFEEILWVEVAGNGGSYYVTDQDNYLVDVTLTKILEQLPKSDFLRISRDMLLNLQHLIKVNKEDRTAIVIKQGKEKGLGIGDSYYSELLKKIKS